MQQSSLDHKYGHLMTDLSPEDCHPLDSFVDALADASMHLMSHEKCEVIEGVALSLEKNNRSVI